MANVAGVRDAGYGDTVKITLGLALALMVTGCAEYEKRMDCRRQAGAEPYAAGNAFGLIGVAIAEAQPEKKEWRARIATCVRLADGR